jgi:hypothetical protein
LEQREEKKATKQRATRESLFSLEGAGFDFLKSPVTKHPRAYGVSSVLQLGDLVKKVL